MRLLLAMLTVLALVPSDANADYAVDFIRISCIREARFLDIEYRDIHNSPVDTEPDPPSAKRTDIWPRHGFFEPENLKYQCSFPDSRYEIVTAQGPGSNAKTCGAQRDIDFSLLRNGVPVISHVAFGGSCADDNFIRRVSIFDGKAGWHGREVEICFGGKSGSQCKWFFDGHLFWEEVPIREESIEKYLSEPQR